MTGRLLPSDDPISERVLEWTIKQNSTDVSQLMRWLKESNGRKEQQILLKRALELMDETQYALQRLDELR
ncbi:MAG: hypothetical protein ACKVHF_00220 [Candidatus Poseidoniales archaeon]|jgi:hypothetical protein|tara:strand:- start:6795 stop:7004 length:210 start_codon:yes stop_codon:yes gene_type:complete